jgi:hypothetical protein
MRRRPLYFLLPLCIVAALSGSLTASASAVDPDRTGPRDLKTMPWIGADGGHDHDHDRPDQVDPLSIPRG